LNKSSTILLWEKSRLDKSEEKPPLRKEHHKLMKVLDQLMFERLLEKKYYGSNEHFNH